MRRSQIRDVLSDLVDACYAEGSSSSWRVCQLCDMEHRPDAAMPGDQTHGKDCAVEAAEGVLRALLSPVESSSEAPPVWIPAPGDLFAVRGLNRHNWKMHGRDVFTCLRVEDDRVYVESGIGLAFRRAGWAFIPCQPELCLSPSPPLDAAWEEVETDLQHLRDAPSFFDPTRRLADLEERIRLHIQQARASAERVSRAEREQLVEERDDARAKFTAVNGLILKGLQYEDKLEADLAALRARVVMLEQALHAIHALAGIESRALALAVEQHWNAALAASEDPRNP